jgi:hypothetical protein
VAIRKSLCFIFLCKGIPKYLQDLLKEDKKPQQHQQKKAMFHFIIIYKQSNKIVGITRYLNIDYDNYRVEIGHI